MQAGVSCTQAVSSASSTTPCVASLLTGTYSFVHGIRSIFGLKLNPTVPTLVETLRTAGYHTVAEVSGPLFPETGLDRGFDVIISVKAQPISQRPGEQTYDNDYRALSFALPGFCSSICGNCIITATFSRPSAAAPMAVTATNGPSRHLIPSWQR